MIDRCELKIKLLSLKVFEDNEYLDKYVDLIVSNAYTSYERFKTQRHHIVPSHVYTHLGMQPDDFLQNLVNLVYTDHILAHFYLFHCSSDKYIKRGNFAALKYIVHNKHVPKQEAELLKALPEYKNMYEEYIKLQSELQKGVQAGEKNPFYGKHHTEQTRAVIRDKIIHLPVEVRNYNKQRTQQANRGRVKTEAEKQKRLDTIEQHGGFGFWITDEYRKKLSESTKGKNTHSKGRIHVNNGIQAKMIVSEELDTYLSAGWQLGRLPVSDEVRQKHRDIRKGKPFTSGRIWVTNGTLNHSIYPEEFDKYHDLGYYRGRTLVKEVK